MDYMKQYQSKLPEEYAHLFEKQPIIICLCGSTRFKELFMQINRDLTKQGAIVIMPGVWGHSGDIITEQEKQNLDDLHKQKIMLADITYIINPDGYIGESTKKEIEFAKLLEKPIWYFDGGKRE